MLSGQKVVILGNGQLGKACQSEFGDNAVSFDRSRIDFSDLANLKLNLHIVLDDIDVLCIINCAAYTNVDKAESEEKELAEIVNAKAVQIIGQYCNTRSIPMIHFSTDFVFDGKNENAYTEDDKCEPINTYGKTKLLGEKTLLEVHDKVLIFRIAWVYSALFDTNFVSKILLAMHNNIKISVPDDQIGNLCNVFDLSKVIHLVVQQIQSLGDVPWGIYHISPLGFENRYKISQRIHRTAMMTYPDFIKTEEISPVATSQLKSTVERPLNSRLNSRKFFHTFGFGMSDWFFSLHNATQKIIKRLSAK